MSSAHPEITRKNPYYTQNQIHYQNWICLERQARTHKHHQKIAHLDAMITKAEEIMKSGNDEKTRFKYAMQCARLRILEIFYLGKESTDYSLTWIDPLHFESDEEHNLYFQMMDLALAFGSRASCPTRIFLERNLSLCRSFTELDKQYGILRYNEWMATRDN